MPDALPAKRAATAADLKQKPIIVDVPGTDLQIHCRRPDPVDLFTSGLIPLEIFEHVVAKLAALQPPPLDGVPEVRVFGDLIDRWVCAVAVEPRIVLTKEAALADDTSVWVEDIEGPIRFEIWRKTNDRIASRRVSEAVQDFREQQSLRALARSNSEKVQHATEPVVVSA